MNLLTRFRSWLKWMVKGQRLESEMETEVRSTLRAAQRTWFAKAFPSKKRCERPGLSSAESSLIKMPCGHPWACAGGAN